MKKKIAIYCNMTGLLLLILAILIGMYACCFDPRKLVIAILIIVFAAPLKIWGYKNSGIDECHAKFH